MEPAILNPVELLAELARVGASVSLADNGKIQLRADHGSAALDHACRRWKWVLSWGLHGAETGYRWFACDACGALSPMGRKPGSTCTMTFGCSGRSAEILLPRFGPGAPHSVRVPGATIEPTDTNGEPDAPPTTQEGFFS